MEMEIVMLGSGVIQTLFETAPQIRVRTKVEGTYVTLERLYLLTNGIVGVVRQEIGDPFNGTTIPSSVRLLCGFRDLAEADLSNKTVCGDWRQTDFKKADCTDTNFFTADVWGSDFREAHLDGANFRSCFGVGNCKWAGIRASSYRRNTNMVGAFLGPKGAPMQSPVVEWTWTEDSEDSEWTAVLADGERWFGHAGSYGPQLP